MYDPTDSLRREPRKEGETETAILPIAAKNGKTAQIQFVSFNSGPYQGQCVMIYKIKGTARTFFKYDTLDLTQIKIMHAKLIDNNTAFVCLVKQGSYGNQSVYYGTVNINNPTTTHFKNVFMNGTGAITSISIGEDGLIHVTNGEREWYIEISTGEVRQFKLATPPPLSSSSSPSAYGKNIPLTNSDFVSSAVEYEPLPPLPGANNTGGNPYKPIPHGQPPQSNPPPGQPQSYGLMPPREQFIPHFRKDG